MHQHVRIFYRLLLSLLLLVPLGRAWAQTATDVVISQIYGGGGNSGATYRNDFIELYNRGSMAVSLEGWSVQYASATGTSWQVTPLTGSILAGGYYLIKQAQGTGGTVDLPTPNATGTIPMSGTAGKVALMSSTTALTVSCPRDISVDFVGFGTTANCYEGTAPTAAPSNTTAVLRRSNGSVDTNDNRADFETGAPNPRNSVVTQATLAVAPATLSGFTTTPGVASASQSYTLTATELSGTIAVLAPAGVVVSTDNATFSSTLTLPQSTTSATLYARLTGATAGPVSGTITHTSGNLSAHVEVSGTVTAPTPITSTVVISQVYGGGGNSGATYKNDFIELYNPGTAAVDLSGWSVQYASATGTSWQRTNLSGTIPAGGYYLIQQAAGSAGTTDLPAPDAIGTIAMAAASGKVALVKSTTALSGACPTDELIVDLVGFGSANCFEGTGATPTLSSTIAALRKSNGSVDTDDNRADFETGAPNPRNSTPVGPSIETNPAALTGTNALYYVEGCGPASKTFTVTGRNFSVESGSITIASSNPLFTVSTTTIPFSGSGVSGAEVTVQLAAGSSEGTYSGTITLTGGGATLEVPVSGIVNSNSPFTAINIARAGVGQTFTIAGRVTVTNQLGARQIYIQDRTGGIVVYSGPSGPDFTTLVELGDSVQVTGPISVYNGFTEITGTNNFTVVDGVPNRIPAPKTITLDQLSSHQGQLVTVTDATITPAGATFTGNTSYTITASNQSATLRINANSPLAGAGRPANPVTVTGIADRFVSGSTTSGTNGLQLQPRILEDIPGSTAAQDLVCEVGGSTTTLTRDQTLDISTWNMEFFGADAGTINCPRGPLNYNDMGPLNEDLQQANVIKVLEKLNADIIAVQEMSSIERLSATVAAIPGGSYSYICSDRFSYYFQDECDQVPTGNPPTVFGPTSLAQKVCVIYNTATVTPVLSETKPLLDGKYNYPSGNGWSSGRLPFMFVADVTLQGVTRRVHVVNIHAKSGSATTDYNRRKQDIQDLKTALDAEYPDANIILLGDYNDKLNGSIAANQPSSYLPFVSDASNYSAITLPLENQGCSTFNSSASFIDHMIVSSELSSAYLDKSAYVLQPFSIPNYGNTTSDHNPLVARFDITKLAAPVTPLAITVAANPTAILSNESTTLTATVSGGTEPYTYEWSGAGTITNGTSATATVSNLPAGEHVFTVKVTDATAPEKQTITATVTVQVTQANLAPVASTIADQSATAGIAFELDVTTAFQDPENEPLIYTATGLPAGLTLTNGTISGMPAVTGSFVVTVTATDPAGLSANASFTLTVGAGPLKMLSPDYDCSTGRLTIRTIAGNGNAVEYQVPSVTTGWTTQPTHILEAKHINRDLKLRARQRRSDNKGYDEVEVAFTPTACGSAAARIGVAEPEAAAELSLQVLGNPVADMLTVDVRGAAGQALQLHLIDLKGRIIEARRIESAGEVEHHAFDVRRQPAGILLLQVSTITQQKVVKIVKN
ncbi:lamin tail domain-containing protein [Telluribacter sp. SYSU D00476]|uniref:lamin tail domain-containing protein n=1 Tax=Telluribacter sp. SYSU D00476 TaxID=2811430 RepID=UPI001FF2BB5E|nr:lamin tail domain-containing protein [Telluribacter sp. SYSU D00476]